jgi:uncharacterized small protein (DUF1192 family)
MGNVYLWKVGDQVVYHTSLEAAAQIDGLSRQPDKTVTEVQFSEAGSLIRLINNKIVLGKTPKEKMDEEALKRIAEIDARFAAIEREIVRPMIAHIKGSPNQHDVDKLNALNAEMRALRAERAEKVQSLSVPF